MKRLFLFSVLMFLFVLSIAQPMFKRTYGLGNINEGKCVIQTSDHGYAVCGSTTPYSGGQTDFYLLKTDSVGVAEFQFAFGGPGIEQSYALVQLPDSGFMVAGFSNSFSGNNDYDGYIIRTDKLGNAIWTKSIGTSTWDFIYDLKAAPDGNYLLAGNSYGSGNGTSSGYIIKIDPLGNVLWQKFIEQPKLVTFKKIAIKNDGTFAVCGNVSSTVSFPEDGFVAFADANGDTLRTVVIDKGKLEGFNSLDYYSNGDIALCGLSIDSTNNNDHDEFVIRMDTIGNVLWDKNFFPNATDECTDLFITNDTLTTVGSSTNQGSGGSDFHIGRFDENAAFMKGTSYGGTEAEYCYSGRPTNDNGLIFLGTSTSYGPGHQSVFLVKTDTAFTFSPAVTIDVEEIKNTNDYLVFPNPSTGHFLISGKSDTKENHLRIMNAEGRVIFERKNQSFPLTINLPDLDPGFYFLEIINNTFSEKKKIVVVK